MRRTGWPLALVILSLPLLLARPTGAAEVPGVVKQVPDDAALFIAVPSLSSLNEKLGMLNERGSIQTPQLARALPMFQAMSGLRQGLDTQRGIAMALLSLPQPGGGQGAGGGQPGAKAGPGGPMAAMSEMVLLLPVSDYQKLLGNFGNKAGNANGISKVRLQGKPTFIKQTGGWAVASPSRATVESYQAPGGNNFAERAGQFGRAALQRSDALIHVNVKQVRQPLQQSVSMGLQQMKRQLEQAPGPAGNAMARAVLDIYGQAIRAYLRDARSATIGLSIEKQGVGLTTATQFEDGTPLHRQFAGKPGGEAALNRLPDDPYLMAASVDTDALPLAEWMRAVSKAMPADNALAPLVESMARSANLARGRIQQGYYLSGGGLGSLNGINVYPTDSPEQFIQQNRKMLEKLGQLKPAGGMNYKVDYKQNALRINGSKVDQYSVSFNLPPKRKRMMGPMAMMLGQGMNGYIVPTENAVVMTNGGSPSLIKKAVETAAGNGKLDADPGIRSVRKHLPDHRAVEAYYGVGNLMRAGQQMIAMFAPNAQFDVPQDLPPVAAALSVRGGGMGERLWVPMPVIKTVAETVRSFGQQGGGPQQQGDAPPVSQTADQRPSQPANAGNTEASNPNGQPAAKAQPASNASASSNEPDGDSLGFVRGGGDRVTVQSRPESKHLARVNHRNFQQKVLSADRPVLLVFKVDGSEPCKTQSPIVSNIADAYHDRATVAKVDATSNSELVRRYGVKAVPTLLLFEQGQVAERFTGLTPQAELSEALEGVTGRQ